MQRHRRTNSLATRVCLDPNFILRQKYEKILSSQDTPENKKRKINEIRKCILLEGIPDETEEEFNLMGQKCTLRGRLWQIMLGVKKVDVKYYVEQVKKGPSSQYQKIRNDTFRTFANNPYYRQRVPEETEIRVLNAFVNSVESQGKNITYIQGLNAICGVFLQQMPEIDAFFTLSQFVIQYCPLYFNPTISGAYTGMRMIDDVLKIVDPELYNFLITKNLKAEVFAMPRTILTSTPLNSNTAVLSFSACTPPVEELYKLWDFYFAYGPHLNILAVVAQIVLNREELIKSSQPNTQLRSLPSLSASNIISLTTQFVRQIPSELYDQLARHPVMAYRSQRRLSTSAISMSRGSQQYTFRSPNLSSLSVDSLPQNL